MSMDSAMLTKKELIWAYGGNPTRDIGYKQAMEYWNENHADIFIINPWDTVRDTNERVKLALNSQ